MIPVPQFVGRINYKPLLPPGELERLKPERVLKSVQREILKRLRAKLMEGPFSAKARTALARGLKTKIGPSSLTVYATHPAFFPLVEGQRAGQMKWLLKAKAPIPIVQEDGTVTFRSATAKSLKDGSWVHPGRQPTTILEQARKETREVIKKRIRKELRKQLQAAMRKRR